MCIKENFRQFASSLNRTNRFNSPSTFSNASYNTFIPPLANAGSKFALNANLPPIKSFFSLTPGFVVYLTLAFALNNNLFQQFIQVYMKNCCQLVSTSASVAESRKDALNKLLKA